jgi:hypothetical protein
MNLLDNDAEYGHLISVAFHHSALTAKPLFDIFRALTVEFLELPSSRATQKERDDFRGVLKVIAAEHEELVTTRNNLVHGTWRIGYSSDEDPNAEYFSVRKLKTTKSGLEKEEAPKHAFELLALKDRCEDTRYWISFVHGCIPRTDRPFTPIAERFGFSDGDWRLLTGPERIDAGTLPRKSR